MTNQKTGKSIIAKSQQDVIEFHTDCLFSLEDLNKINPETEEQKNERTSKNEKALKEMSKRISRKKYNKLTETMAGSNNKRFI